MSDSAFSPFIARDGQRLAIQDWMPERGRGVRGVVLVVHGLGEHSGRYEVLAQTLNRWDFAVRAYDQYGHGDSAGVPGGLPDDNRLLEDLAEMVDLMRARMAPDLPLILLGHSLGGLVAARFVSLNLRPVEALVLSSPALAMRLNPVQKLLLAVLPGLLPDLRMRNGLNPALLSHDPEVVAAYKADRLVHNRISARMARFMAQAAADTLAAAPAWSVPTLLLYAGDDRVVNPEGSRRFARAAPQAVLSSVCFGALYHEIFNERDVRPVMQALGRWLGQRF